MVEIRAEKPVDIAAIRAVHQQAFFPGLDEAYLVEALRQAQKIPISLVAHLKERVVGHILFSAITITPAPLTTMRGLGLGPVGVLPEFQKQGIGSNLITHGLGVCRQRGYDIVVVLGDPHFYTRFGFERAGTHQLENEYGVDQAFMVTVLRSGALDEIKGMVKYATEFNSAGC